MIKTLKITSILFGLAALGFVVFVVTKGLGKNESAEKFLAQPGIAEQRKDSVAAKTTRTTQDSPLIRQAQAFALRIDPPPPPEPIRTARPEPRETRKAPPRPKVEKVIADFKLIGTSTDLENDAQSWALIDQVGQGLKWVKKGQPVGHLRIEDIGPGAVLIADQGQTYTLQANRTPKQDYVNYYSGQLPDQLEAKDWQNAPAKTTAKTTITKGQPGEQQSPDSSVPAPAEPEKTKTPSPESIKSNIEWLQKIRSNPDEAGISEKDSKTIEGLGDMLKSLEAELEMSRQSEAQPDEPNQNNVQDQEQLQNLLEQRLNESESEPDDTRVRSRKEALEAIMKRRRRSRR